MPKESVVSRLSRPEIDRGTDLNIEIVKKHFPMCGKF
jgi:hypothetical protein